MDLKEKKVVNVKIILSVVAILILICSLAFMITRDKEESNLPVSHKVVEKLYEDHNDNKCTEVIKITDNVNVGDVDDKVLLYLIFGQMKKDKVIGSSISLDDYNKSALKVVDKKYIPLNFNYVFEGYKYVLNGDKITRKSFSCDKNYVTKLYGYSGSDKLELDVMAGYVKGGKVYDLNDKELGVYSKKDLNKLLDNGTMQVYNYEKVDDNYKLVSAGVK